MTRKITLVGGVFLAITTLPACEALKDALDGVAGECTEVCTRIGECEGQVNPPEPVLPGDMGLGDIELPSIAACATNCVDAANREFNGYSDCQVECILGVDECGDINDCWSVTSDAYAEYCLADRETSEVTVDDAEVDNGTTSGSVEADAVVTNPAVEESVAGSGTVIHFGNEPPKDIAKLWHAEGTIDSSSNAREVGSRIDTKLCFFDMDETSEGWEVSYCEVGVLDGSGTPLTDTAPITGDEEGGWTIYLEFTDVGSIIFSGQLEDGATLMTDVDALVTYYHGMDIWEHSETNWDTDGETCSLSDCY